MGFERGEVLLVVTVQCVRRNAAQFMQGRAPPCDFDAEDPTTFRPLLP